MKTLQLASKYNKEEIKELEQALIDLKDNSFTIKDGKKIYNDTYLKAVKKYHSTISVQTKLRSLNNIKHK